MIKRLISILLVLSVLLVWIPTSVVAANPDQNIFGAGTSWTLSDGTLTISGSGAVEFNTRRDSGWIKGITAVVIENGITEIKERTFENFENVTKVTIPGTVTSICYSAFENCKSLTSVSIPAGVKSIEKETFAGCSKLTGVTIPSTVTSIGNAAFRACTSLTSVVVPAGVKNVGANAFRECTALSDVTLSNGIASIGSWAFFECRSLSGIGIPTSVTNIGDYAFGGCTSLTDIDIPGSVKNIGDFAFKDCTRLSRVSLPSNITSICYSGFENCTSLTSLTIPSTVTSIGNKAFKNCSALTSISMPKSVVKVGETAFQDCNNLSDVYYGGDAAAWSKIEIKEFNESLLGAAIHYNEYGGIIRLAGNNRYDTAYAAANELKSQLEVDKFSSIIVSSGEEFADALAGSYLAAVKDAPILLVKNNKAIMNEVKKYIKENLASGGTVYLLGGEKAVPKAMESDLDGFTVKRLGGNTRYDTNLRILQEAGVEGKNIIVCTGKNFADALSASAVGLPILLVKDSLNDAQKAFLQGTTGEKIIIGGKNAVSDKIATQLEAYGKVTRLAGSTRYDSSVLVAKTFFTEPDQAVVAYSENFPDGLSGGPVANAAGAPLLLTKSGKETAAMNYVSETGITKGYVMGGEAVLPNKTINKVFGIK